MNKSKKNERGLGSFEWFSKSAALFISGITNLMLLMEWMSGSYRWIVWSVTICVLFWLACPSLIQVFKNRFKISFSRGSRFWMVCTSVVISVFMADVLLCWHRASEHLIEFSQQVVKPPLRLVRQEPNETARELLNSSVPAVESPATETTSDDRDFSQLKDSESRRDFLLSRESIQIDGIAGCGSKNDATLTTFNSRHNEFVRLGVKSVDGEKNIQLIGVELNVSRFMSAGPNYSELVSETSTSDWEPRTVVRFEMERGKGDIQSLPWRINPMGFLESQSDREFKPIDRYTRALRNETTHFDIEIVATEPGFYWYNIVLQYQRGVDSIREVSVFKQPRCLYVPAEKEQEPRQRKESHSAS